MALAFRVGLFNIGGRGQITVAAIFSAFVSLHFPLPGFAAIVAAILAGIIGGALWGGIVGILRAKTGAHEVIMTIMLNYVAFNLLVFLLKTPALQQEGQVNPKSPPIPVDARLPTLFPGLGWQVDVGFLVVIAVTIGVWWLLNRSSLGFRFRAVGENPHAARVAGIDVKQRLPVRDAHLGRSRRSRRALFLNSPSQTTNGLSRRVRRRTARLRRDHGGAARPVEATRRLLRRPAVRRPPRGKLRHAARTSRSTSSA